MTLETTAGELGAYGVSIGDDNDDEELVYVCIR
jgi:hypothetical protein